LTGAEYARQYAAAIAGDWLDAFREQHRSSALFVLDGIGQLASKRAAQQELCRTLDILSDQEAFVVITDRTLPWHLTSLAPALQSRLSAGLAVPLAVPGGAVRRMVLERLATERGLTMTKRTVDALVAGLAVPLARLHEGLASLQAQSAGSSIELRDVRQFLLGQHRAKAPTLKNIALVTAKYYGLKLSELKSPLRRQQLVAARGIVIYLARRLTGESLMTIGAFLGGRDHTTILHGYQRTEKLIKRDPMTRHAVAELGRVLLPD
jgi:chromosomal replication initiator protein